MGLDMYLSKRTSVKNWDFEKGKKTEITLKGPKTKGIKTEKISEIIEDAGYWRKANQIHGWIVENVQDGEDDCKEYHFPRNKMEELLELCEKVNNDKILAPKLLPITQGFFFGGEEYDEYYFEDIEDTIKILKEALADDNAEYYYQSSW